MPCTLRSNTLNRSGLSVTVSVIAILTLSSLIPALVVAQGSQQVQWNGPMANYPFNWNNSPQGQISPANVQNLQLSWVFPIPAAPPGVTQQGTTVTPLIINGIAYTVTNFNLLLAMDAKNGKIIWQVNVAKLNQTGFPKPVAGSHYHSLYYTSKVRGVPLIWVSANYHAIYAFNALTGDVNLAFDSHIGDPGVPGNFGNYGAGGHAWMAIDERRGIFVIGNAGSEGTSAGRGYFQGYDITQTPPTLLWRTFIMPPQDGSDPTWSIKSVANMSNAWIFDAPDKTAVDLKSLPQSQVQSMLNNDWGNFGFNGTRSFAGVGTGWGGSWTVDPATGIAYVGTAQPGPDWNATTRPGPNLWSASVLAIDDTTGKIVWAFKATPHDLWDFDCSWGVMLANSTSNGQTQKTIFKGCKNGYFYALNAATGKMLWYFDPPSIKRTPGTRLLNPLNATQMKQPWGSYPSTTFVQNPPASGGIESDPAYDPTTNTVFFVAYNNPTNTKILPVTGKGVAYGAAGFNFFTATVVPGATNSTAWAVDSNTGQAKWHYDIPSIGFRGGITFSNGVLYIPRNDGLLDMVDGATGKILNSKFIGAALVTEPAIATDANGDAVLVMPGSGAIGSLQFGFLGFPTQPGYLFAMNLPAPPKASTTTVVSSVVSTVSVSSGIDPTTFYATLAVAVILLITTGFLAVRRKARSP